MHVSKTYHLLTCTTTFWGHHLMSHNAKAWKVHRIISLQRWSKNLFFTTNSSWNISKFIFVWKINEKTFPRYGLSRENPATDHKHLNLSGEPETWNSVPHYQVWIYPSVWCREWVLHLHEPNQWRYNLCDSTSWTNWWHYWCKQKRTGRVGNILL